MANGSQNVELLTFFLDLTSLSYNYAYAFSDSCRWMNTGCFTKHGPLYISETYEDTRKVKDDLDDFKDVDKF